MQFALRRRFDYTRRTILFYFQFPSLQRQESSPYGFVIALTLGRSDGDGFQTKVLALHHNPLTEPAHFRSAASAEVLRSVEEENVSVRDPVSSPVAMDRFSPLLSPAAAVAELTSVKYAEASCSQTLIASYYISFCTLLPPACSLFITFVYAPSSSCFWADGWAP